MPNYEDLGAEPSEACLRTEGPESGRDMNDKTPSIAGISGGRTSALMALEHVPAGTVLCFQNTGREHSKTLDFLRRLEDDLRRPIVRLEWRAPPRGDPPKNSRFEVVPHEQLSRKGEPFRDLLECVAAFRKKHKGLGPVAPWARSRICTAYLKVRTQRDYCRALGWTDWTTFVGLRADEPDRVAKMRGRNEERDGDERAPLFDAGIVKADVLRYWERKPYDLNIPEHLGNCTGCFLKDEADLATALLDVEGDPQWWIDIERDFAPMRRGRSSYAQVFEEAGERLRIRDALAAGREPTSALPLKRHLTVLRQEQRRLSEGAAGFSCSCEGAEKMDDADLLAGA